MPFCGDRSKICVPGACQPLSTLDIYSSGSPQWQQRFSRGADGNFELTSCLGRLQRLRFFALNKDLMTGHAFTTGFETPQALKEFNAAWVTVGVSPEEIWPLPTRTFEFMLSGSDATLVRSRDDVVEFERRTGLPVRYGPYFMDWVRDEWAREGIPLKQLNTSLHEACHLVAGEMAGFPHAEVIGPVFACTLEEVAGVLKIANVRYEPATVVHDPDSAKRFYTEKPTDYAAMLLAPLCVMPRLIPSATDDSDFIPDIVALMRHVPGQEDTGGLVAAATLTDRPEFLERVQLWARTLRPLIRKGGITQLPQPVGGDRARSASAG
jgi:hypothetical protein